MLSVYQQYLEARGLWVPVQGGLRSVGSGTGRPGVCGYWYPQASDLQVQLVDPVLKDFRGVSKHQGL